jgi:hypothetical protein
MGTLKAIRQRRKDIEVDGDTFAVRALSLNDVMALSTQYGPALAGLYQKFIKSAVDGDELGGMDLALIGKTLVESSPDLAVAIIAYGAGEPKEIENAKTLPFPTQLEALQAIFEFTFASEADVKKVLEIVTVAMEKTTSLIASVQRPQGIQLS